MRFLSLLFVLLAFVGTRDLGKHAVAQSVQQSTVDSASVVLREAMSRPLNRVPAALLADCHGVAIVPNVIKGSFIVGARRGKGLLFVRDADGTWHAPVFITLTGGNIGWQVGVQSSDIVLVFKTARSVQGILNGKLTIGGDASAAAGPVGRQGAVATDGQLKAEIYTYSRSRGLFAGVSIDGSVIRVDQLATGTYYQSPDPSFPSVVPASVMQLTRAVADYAGHAAAVSPPDAEPRFVKQVRADQPSMIRDQLLQIAPGLFSLLDPQWTSYLALPLASGQSGEPTLIAVQRTLEKYDRVAANPQYAELSARPEFRSVHGLLKHYEQTLSPHQPNLNLPPPPTPTMR